MMKLPGSHEPDLTPPTGWTAYLAATPPGSPPAAPRLPLAFEPFLLLEPAYQALQQHGHPVLACFLEDEAAGRTVAQLYVVLDAKGPGLARSPGQASFGGVQLAPGLPAVAVSHLLAAAEAGLRERGQHQLEMRPYASCYDPAGAATLAEALGQRGYTVVLTEQNYYLDTQRDYTASLAPSERRYLHRCQQAGLVVEQEPPLLLPLAYEFIAECRRERGYSLSPPLERVQALVRAFPRQHVLLSVREPGTGDWAAMLLASRVSPAVFYNFYLASPKRFDKLSPSVLLLGGLHGFARANEAAVVDLGTATLPTGQPNEPLSHFKRALGGLESLRLTWHKQLG